jgi:hypothetical protein
MNIERDVHIPAELLLVGIQNFPFKRRNVLNFFIQGTVVFVASALFGYIVGHSITALCN